MNREFRADLHCHTTCSDGTFSPAEIIALAKQKGLQGLSITDHDTINAYTEAVPLAQAEDILLLSGVEFSAMHQDISVHILGYSFRLDSSIIRDFCQKHNERRIDRNRVILKLLAAQNIDISEADLHEHPEIKQSIGRPHIALAMVRKGYVVSIQDAFNRYLGDKKACYYPGESFSIEETLDTIHQANGLAMIAHPHLLDNPKILRDLLEMPFDGLEGYYARFNMDQQKRWLKIADHRGWMVTGGSDFHGAIKPSSSLGSSWVDLSLFTPLYERFKANNNLSQ